MTKNEFDIEKVMTNAEIYRRDVLKQTEENVSKEWFASILSEAKGLEIDGFMVLVQNHSLAGIKFMLELAKKGEI